MKEQNFVYLKTIAYFIDHFNFEDLFQRIKMVNSNSENKTELEHFVSIIFGKLAEYYVGKQIKKNCGCNLEYSPLKNNVEIADIVIEKIKTVEVRSSFQKHLNDNLNHIVRYVNPFKKQKETYKNYYFQVFFLENVDDVKEKLKLLFELYQHFKSNKENLKNKMFEHYLIENNFNLETKICPIVNKTFIKLNLNLINDEDFVAKNNLEIKQLKQKNTFFESKKLKNCLSIEEGFEIIKNDLINLLINKKFQQNTNKNN